MPARFSEYLKAMKVPKKAQTTWEQFGYTLDELIDDKGTPVAPASMITSVVEGVYADYMKAKFKNYEQRAQDLEQLGSFAARYSEPIEFLSQLALLSGVDTENTPAAEVQDRDAVTLTTGHQAKGLEWQVVFAIWLADGMFPNRRVLDEGSAEGLEEERRLFYVTVTRAKDELYMIYPLIHHAARDGNILQTPSRFISDLPGDLMEPWNVRSVF
jgi:DNA helicase-2/ATP-dependent DNA helicase PcrA